MFYIARRSFVTLLLGLVFLGAFSREALAFAPTVPYCDLFEGSAPKSVKAIRTTAYMAYSTVGRVDGDDTFLYSPDCNSGDFFSTVESERSAWTRYPGYLNRLASGKHHVLKITFEGSLEITNSHLYGSLDGWARANIKISKVIKLQTLTNAKDLVTPDSSSASPEVKRIEQLREDFLDFLSSLFSSPRALSGTMLADDFVLKTIDRSTLRRLDFLQPPPFLRPIPIPEGGTIGISRSITYSSPLSITGKGVLEILVNRKVVARYSCETEFVLSESRWVIARAAIREQPYP